MESKIQTPEERILKILEQGPVTPDEVAQKLGIAWATAQGHLLRLVASAKVVTVRKGRVNIYLLKFPSSVTPKTPPWAKARNLKDLAEELESYFPKGVSASEIVELERRRS